MKKALVILHGIMVALAAFSVSLIYTVIKYICLDYRNRAVPTQVDYCLMVLAVMLLLFRFIYGIEGIL